MPTVIHKNLPGLLSPVVQRLPGAMVILGLLTILAGVISIPFFFDSSSLLYKFAIDKTLIRSGKVLGMMAACLLIMQSVFNHHFFKEVPHEKNNNFSRHYFKCACRVRVCTGKG